MTEERNSGLHMRTIPVEYHLRPPLKRLVKMLLTNKVMSVNHSSDHGRGISFGENCIVFISSEREPAPGCTSSPRSL